MEDGSDDYNCHIFWDLTTHLGKHNTDSDKLITKLLINGDDVIIFVTAQSSQLFMVLAILFIGCYSILLNVRSTSRIASVVRRRNESLVGSFS